jgi:dTDP-4-dehydrorhamnose reductase
MEERVLTVLDSALVVRTGAVFGPWDEGNFVTRALRALAAGERVEAASDVVVSPTYVVDLVHAVLDLLIDGASGVWHLANEGAVTWAELARRAAEAAAVTPDRLLDPRPARLLGLVAPRPRFSALGTERGQLLPPLADALVRYVRHRALTVGARPHAGEERRRNFRPWRYEQAGAWI